MESNDSKKSVTGCKKEVYSDANKCYSANVRYQKL